MTFDFRKAIVLNWPIKLTALALSGILWAAVASQEPATQLVTVMLNVEPPAGRALTQPPAEVQALVSGTARELFRLYTDPPFINKRIPETRAPSYTLELSMQEINFTSGVNVTVQDIRPRSIEVYLDTVAQRWVPVDLRVAVVPDNGFELVGGLRADPESVLVVGPRSLVRDVVSVPTIADTVFGVRGSYAGTVPLDTTGLRVVDTSVREITVAADVTEIATRVLSDIPVTVAGRTGEWETETPTVLVTVEGPSDRVNRLTEDSVAVFARPTSPADSAVVRLSIRAPLGITAWVTPDSMSVWRKRRG